MRVVVTDAPPSLGKEWSRRENRDAKKCPREGESRRRRARLGHHARVRALVLPTPPARSAGHVPLDDAPGRVACVWGEGRTFRGEEGGFACQKISRDAHAGSCLRRNAIPDPAGGFFGTTIAAPCTVSGEGKKTLRAVARSSRVRFAGPARDAPMVTCACVTPASCSISQLSGTKHPAMSAEVLSRFTMLGDASEKTTALSSGSP